MADLVQNQNGTYTYQNAGTDNVQAENTGGVTASPLATPSTVAATAAPKSLGADILAPAQPILAQPAKALPTAQPASFSTPAKAAGVDALTSAPAAKTTTGNPVTPSASPITMAPVTKPATAEPVGFSVTTPDIQVPTWQPAKIDASNQKLDSSVTGNLPTAYAQTTPQQQKDANELANYWKSSWQKISETMASSGLSQDGIAIMAMNQGQVDLMGKINEANINEDLAKKADRQFGLDSLEKVLDLADKGLIDHTQVNAMLDALQAGDVGKAGAIMDSFKPVLPKGNYSDITKAMAVTTLYDEAHVLYTMSSPYEDGSVDVKPLLMQLPDGSKTLAKSTDPRLTTMLNSGKKITSTYNAADNTVTYTQTDEAAPANQTAQLAQDGTIVYGTPTPGTPGAAPAYDRTNTDAIQAADYGKWKAAITGQSGQTPLGENDIPALTDFANKGSADAKADLMSVVTSNPLTFADNIDKFSGALKADMADQYAKTLPETKLGDPNVNVVEGQYFKMGGVLYKMDRFTYGNVQSAKHPGSYSQQETDHYVDVKTGNEKTFAWPV
jgi:hypothetical protein